MGHPLVLAVFTDAPAAAAAARALHAIGISRDQISVVARSHDEEGALAAQMDATPGSEVEDSRDAGRLGELGGQVLAAIAVAMPGIGPLLTAGPLAADLGEAIGHAAGGVAGILTRAGVERHRAEALQRDIDAGAILVAVHIPDLNAEPVRDALLTSGARDPMVIDWER